VFYWIFWGSRIYPEKICSRGGCGRLVSMDPDRVSCLRLPTWPQSISVLSFILFFRYITLVFTMEDEDTSQLSHSPFESIPLEVLADIFAFDDDFYEKNEPSIEVGGQSPWAVDLRFKKAVMAVCRKWWAVGVRALFHRVYLHRIGQLCAFIKVQRALRMWKCIPWLFSELEKRAFCRIRKGMVVGSSMFIVVFKSSQDGRTFTATASTVFSP